MVAGVVVSLLWSLLASGCTSPESKPDDPSDGDDTPVAEEDPPGTDETEDAPVLSPVPPEVVATLGGAFRGTIAAAALIHRAPLEDMLNYIRDARDPGCSDLTPGDDGVMLYEVHCKRSGDIETTGEMRWRDLPATSLDDDASAWAHRWLGVVCPGVDPDLPLDPPPLSLMMVGSYVERDPAKLMFHLRGAFAHVAPVWSGCSASRTAADGYADVDGAPPSSWTGSDLEVQVVEVGRARSGAAALLTIEGTMGGVTGAIRTVDVTGGSWLVDGAGCAIEPEGVWGLRTDDGAWYDVTFDAVCDGCGVMRSPGFAETPACITAEDAAAISALVQAAVP